MKERNKTTSNFEILAAQNFFCITNDPYASSLGTVIVFRNPCYHVA